MERVLMKVLETQKHTVLTKRHSIKKVLMKNTRAVGRKDWFTNPASQRHKTKKTKNTNEKSVRTPASLSRSLSLSLSLIICVWRQA